MESESALGITTLLNDDYQAACNALSHESVTAYEMYRYGIHTGQ